MEDKSSILLMEKMNKLADAMSRVEARLLCRLDTLEEAVKKISESCVPPSQYLQMPCIPPAPFTDATGDVNTATIILILKPEKDELSGPSSPRCLFSG